VPHFPRTGARRARIHFCGHNPAARFATDIRRIQKILMAINDAAIRNAEIREKPYRLADSDKLYLQVYPNGVKGWRVRYRKNGKETMLSLGNYPTVSLRDARTKRDEINVMLSKNIDPVDERKLKVQQNESRRKTIASVYPVWLEERKPPVWSAQYYSVVKRRIIKYLLPKLGNIPLEELTPPQILAVIKNVEKQGTIVTAHLVLQLCSKIFKYSIAHGWVVSDPCRDLTGALAPVKTQHRAAIINPASVGKLLIKIDNFCGTSIVHYALKILPLVFVRPAELAKSVWEEIDFSAAEWRIPAMRMKMRGYHVVPLARQTLQLLRELHEISGHRNYLFPNKTDDKRPMYTETLLHALRNLGYDKSEITAHGFRVTASTLLNELGWREDYIERQLAHVPRNKVRAVYNRAGYLPERRKMMQAWADYLDSLREQALAPVESPAADRNFPG
jgi:integrase